MTKLSQADIDAIIQDTTKDGTQVLYVDRENDCLRVRFTNGREWTLYLSVLHADLKNIPRNRIVFTA